MREFKELLADKQAEGLTQTDISKATKVSTPTISRFKNGKNDYASPETYAKLKEYFGEDCTVGGETPGVVTKKRKPKPNKYVIEVSPEDTAIDFIIDHLGDNGKTIVPRHFLGKEDKMIELLKQRGITATYTTNENGGVVKVVCKQPGDDLDLGYLKSEEPCQPRCEIVEYEDPDEIPENKIKVIHVPNELDQEQIKTKRAIRAAAEFILLYKKIELETKAEIDPEQFILDYAMLSATELSNVDAE